MKTTLTKFIISSIFSEDEIKELNDAHRKDFEEFYYRSEIDAFACIEDDNLKPKFEEIIKNKVIDSAHNEYYSNMLYSLIKEILIHN